MEYILMILSILIFTVQTICFKEFNRTFMKNLGSYFIFNFLYFGIVAIIFLLLNTNPEGMHTPTILTAVSFGILFTITMLLYMKAMENGPLSYTSLIFSFGLLIPIIFGVSLWKEKISGVQAAGLVLLFITFYMGSKSSENSAQKPKLKWILYCITALIGNGFLMTVSKAQQMIMPGKEIKEFLILSFGTASLFSLLLFFYHRIKAGENISHLKNRLFFILVPAAGITTAFGNQIALYLSGRIPAVVQFPTVNGGVVILSSILSFVIFKEKLSSRGILGLFIGLCSLILLSIK